MRTIKNLFLFVPLLMFVGCQGPYDKPEKAPVEIGLTWGDNAKKEEDAAAKDTKSPDEMIDMSNKGVGPVKEVTLGKEIDKKMATAGEKTFNTLCVACHRLDKRFVGPALGDVMSIRSPEWVMNMILNPIKMLQEDPIAKALLAEYKAPMADLGLTKEQARQIVEYLRTTKQ